MIYVARYIGWVDKIKDAPDAKTKSKPQKRLVIVGDRLFFSVKQTLLGGLSIQVRRSEAINSFAAGMENALRAKCNSLKTTRPPHPPPVVVEGGGERSLQAPGRTDGAVRRR